MPFPSRNAAADPAPRPLLLGHRGARKQAPENTLAAFDLALQQGCDGFEFDVRRTADGMALICHDPVVAGAEIAKTPYRQILNRACSDAIPKALRLLGGGLPGGGKPLPLLEDVLERYAVRAFLDIEVKVTGLEDQVLEALHSCPPQRGFVVSSFQAEILKSIRARDARVPLGLICDQRKELVRWPVLPVEYIIPHSNLLTRNLIEEAHTAGKKILVWTVNSKGEMLRLAKAGVEGIISDDTQRLVRTLGGNT